MGQVVLFIVVYEGSNCLIPWNGKTRGMGLFCFRCRRFCNGILMFGRRNKISVMVPKLHFWIEISFRFWVLWFL